MNHEHIIREFKQQKLGAILYTKKCIMCGEQTEVKLNDGKWQPITKYERRKKKST